MPTEGEYITGAYLQLRLNCDFVAYNVKVAGGGLEGLGELDVVGLRFEDDTAVLAEVTTHLHGLRYGSSYEATAQRVREKHERQRVFADSNLHDFDTVLYQFWCLRVPVGPLVAMLEGIDGLELVINREYTRRVDELRGIARLTKHDIGNPFFRTLQILEHMRQN